MKRTYSQKEIRDVIALSATGLTSEQVAGLTGITAPMVRTILSQERRKRPAVKSPTPAPFVLGVRWFGMRWR